MVFLGRFMLSATIHKINLQSIMLLVYRHDIFLRDENLPFFGQIEGHDKELLSKRVICFRMAILFVVGCVK